MRTPTCLRLPLLLTGLLAACAPADGLQADGLPPESDAHAALDPERNVVVASEHGPIQVTDLPGAEDGEAVSPDGRFVAFVAGATGIASVWVAPVPGPGEAVGQPVQLTNVGLERVRREPGQAPAGFVPPPDHGPLRWEGDRTVAWTAAGVVHRVQVPR